MKYNLFIGRFQSPHKGHQAIFNQYLSQGLPVLIAIRDTPCDSDNPLTAHQVKYLWEKIYSNNPLVHIIIIPDIATVNYGRGVGYEVKEIKVEKSIHSISATAIRNSILDGEESWKEYVDSTIHDALKMMILED